MTRFFAAAVAGTFLLLAAPGLSAAAPINNSDGSQTCNASGPSGGADDGVCANDLKTNEDFCEGGMSTEPGGGTTCSESRRGPGGKPQQVKQAPGAKPLPQKKPAN